MRIGWWWRGQLSSLQMATITSNGEAVPQETFAQNVLGCPSLLIMPIPLVPNFTELSKEESVTVSVTESDWIPLGKPGGKASFPKCMAKPVGLAERKRGCLLCGWIWGSLLEWKDRSGWEHCINKYILSFRNFHNTQMLKQLIKALWISFF